jgi:hypothetical protein
VTTRRTTVPQDVTQLPEPGRLPPTDQPEAPHLKDEALRYLEAGLSIIPCRPNKKARYPWKEYQTRRPTSEEINEWWEKNPSAMIGLVTGELNNLTVIDCDSKESLESVRALLPAGLEIVSTTSQSGGTHLFFCYTPDLSTVAGVRKDLDVRSEGGYVIVPPSRGQKGPYSWNDAQDIRTCSFRPSVPPALLSYLTNGTDAGSKVPAQPLIEVLPDGTPEPLGEGVRDNKLFHMALKLFQAGEPSASVEQFVLTAARGCIPPFPEDEALKKVASAHKYWLENRGQGRNLRGESALVESLATRNAADIHDRAIQWLWHGVFPTHMATSLTGHPGVGKTLVAVDLAARISTGAEFPIYDIPSPPIHGRVLYVTTEGVPEMILVPRLRVAGADLNNIDIIEGTNLRDGEFSILDVTRDLPRLKQLALDRGDVKLLVIDPVASVLPVHLNPNQQNHVRRAMDIISNLAYDLGLAAVIVMHWAKDESLKGANRTAGSMQFGAAMKMSWGVAHRDDDTREVRVLVPQKSNINANHNSLRFSICGVEYSSIERRETIMTSKIEYGGLLEDEPEGLLNTPQDEENNVTRACSFLRKKFKTQDRLAALELAEGAEKDGIPVWALYRARKKLKVVVEKESRFGGRSFWFKGTKA